MKVTFGQTLTAADVRRATLTRLVATLIDDGVPPATVMADVTDGLDGLAPLDALLLAPSPTETADNTEDETGERATSQPAA